MSNQDRIKKFMADHGVGDKEIWPVPGGKSYAVYHHVLERIAYQNHITFDPPTIIEANSAEGIVSMLVTGRKGEFSEWSIGEAAPRNNKNSYVWAMAEKRAKDRVILKLLNMHGIIYSDAELDDSKPTRAANDTKPAEPEKPQEPERDPTEIEAANKLSKMLESCPSVAALDALMQSDEWKDHLEMAHEDDKPGLRKAYRIRRETLTYKEAS